MGQNFLKSEPALRTMCSAGEIKSDDVILEIGPGKGALTTKLLKEADKVIAIEKDRELFEFLKEKFSNEIKNGKLGLINDDILKINLRELFLNFLNGLAPRPPSSEDLKKIPKIAREDYKVISNIPYNITGAIFKKFLSSDIQPERMVLLVQKEVAERIVARDGKESILSLSVRAYGTPKYIMKVHKRFFSPSPKVDSAIVAINNISKNNFRTNEEENNFFDVVRAGFAHKRKVLRKNLEILQKNPGQIVNIFEKLKINPKARAEDIKFEIWLEISRHLSTDI